MDLSNILLSKETAVTDPTQQVFNEYMAGIIKQLPNPSQFNVLTGTANSQVSFYYKSPTTGQLNSTFYNNQLSQRIKCIGEEYGVEQVKVLSSAFINAYNQLYLSMRYQLSQKDQATQQELEAETAGKIKHLRPMWNAWVSATPDTKVPKLDDNDTMVALVQVTATLNYQWINPDYSETLDNDPSYPYTHMQDFDTIYNRIPLSVPREMRDDIKDIYSAQGNAGAFTARLTTATQTISGIRYNIQHPSVENGGMPISGSTQMVPGLKITPGDPITLIKSLGADPPTGTLSASASVTKIEDEKLSVEVSGGSAVSIPIFDFFSLDMSGGMKSSIFKENYAGSQFSVDVVLNNPTLEPSLTVTPVNYDISTSMGWMYPDPVKQALANAGKTDVTGYVFDSAPSFDFGENGDFGYISTYVLSQFMELNLTFNQCQSKEVKEYFEQHTSATISFLGIPLGGASESSNYSYHYFHETDSSIRVSLKPNPPGYTPGGSEITQSLCNLVAVGVVYPFA